MYTPNKPVHHLILISDFNKQSQITITEILIFNKRSLLKLLKFSEVHVFLLVYILNLVHFFACNEMLHLHPLTFFKI